jgi:hypothetical protein
MFTYAKILMVIIIHGVSKKGNQTSANYSACEQLVFIFGKIGLLAIEWHAFHTKWRKISMYEADQKC